MLSYEVRYALEKFLKSFTEKLELEKELVKLQIEREKAKSEA